MQSAAAIFQPYSSTPDFVGASAAIRSIDRDIDGAARSDAKVLITGETGVGKDVVANLIHRRSARRAGRFVVINCAGVPDSLLESELFGHARGSFTGAYRDKPGLLEIAHNGTVFLDEVGEMSMRMQAVLLRFLETGELQRVGADQVHARVHVRVIAATNRDCRTQIASGAFREDLYYRLNVVRIHLPALRERREDVAALFDHFVRIASRDYGVAPSTLSPEALDALRAYDWPGNVRQLRNVVEHLMLRAAGTTISPQDLPPEICGPRAAAADVHAPSLPSMAARLVADMVEGGQSFWSAVHPLFMDRDLQRSILRDIVAEGLARTAGNYRTLVALFNMPAEDYKRFMSFLRKHGCLVPFYPFRVASVRRPGDCPGADARQ